ncbi:TetR/AcrR family transcriptional regulator [Streptomyces rectiviolaceus]|uniref:TetR/AcrR family transcriptional regulator n=1 Tax=Streptomyces rectiviolaceus TaxID=332591 RepID=UPI00363A59FF
MTEELGLRARKKKQTAARIWRVAVDLCSERGFDHVSVAEIAEAAEVSKMTVFNYFGTKEGVIVSPMEEHVGDPARAVRERQPGSPRSPRCAASSWSRSADVTHRSASAGTRAPSRCASSSARRRPSRTAW